MIDYLWAVLGAAAAVLVLAMLGHWLKESRAKSRVEKLDD